MARIAAIWLAVTLFSTPAAAVNYSDIWWNPAESGWGLTIADHDSQLFAVWYTYGLDGRPTWFVVPGGTFSADKSHFQGDVFATTGPAFSSVPFDSTRVTARKVGTAVIDFASPSAGTFTYDVNGVHGAKAIQRQPFGSGAPDWGNDLTDIWFNPAESGWGVTLAQHGNNVFGVWFTYDTDGQPLWAVIPGGTFNGPDAFTGTFYTTTGPYFGTTPFDPARVVSAPQGSVTINVTREGRLDLQCAGAQNAAFNWTLRGASASAPICQQGFGDLPGVVAPAPALPSIAPVPAGLSAPGTATGVLLAMLAPDFPELAAAAPALQDAEAEIEGLLRDRLPAAKAADPARKDLLDLMANSFTLLTVAMQRFSQFPRGTEIPARQVDGRTASGDVSGGRAGDGTTHASYSYHATTSSPDGPLEVSVSAEGHGLVCPGEDGAVPFSLHAILDMHFMKNGKIAGGRLELLTTGTAGVNDAANIAHVEHEWRMQQSTQRPESHNAYVDASYKGSVNGEFGHGAPWTGTFKYNRIGSTTTPQDLETMGTFLGTAAAMLETGYLVFTQVFWQDSNCVVPQAALASTVAPNSSTSFEAKVHYKPDDIDVALPLDAKLVAGGVSVQPGHVNKTPATLVYVAPNESGKSATINLKTTSRRGIGELEVSTVTSSVGYLVDWSDGAGNHVSGTICGGLASPFTLGFDSGGVISGTLRFTPSGANGGSVHLTGTGGGGVLAYSGDGTFTVTDSPLTIHMSIPTQTAFFPGGSVSVPGPSGDLPVSTTSQCGG
jgi:hypothetical protein